MNKVYIIAEAGVNHNGSLETAKKLINAAANAGVDAIKFQTFVAKKLVTKSASMADYQKRNTGVIESQYEMLKKLELNEEKHQAIFEYCKKKNVEFLSTPFDSESLKMLIEKFSLEKIKISSGDLTNAPFLLEIACLQKDVILSTGMASVDEIKEALSVLAFGYLSWDNPSVNGFNKAYNSEEGQALLKRKVTLLHCTTQYPTRMEEINLNAMITIKNIFQLQTGYSDHSMGIHIPIAAVSMGATLIEKHFTLSRDMDGPDHVASLEPEELKTMVSNIRDIEIAFGSFEKAPTKSEIVNKQIARKSIVAAKEIVKGEVYTLENLTLKRPEEGMRPIKMWELLGTKASRNYNEDELIKNE